MAESTRNYINQWIIKSFNATEKSIFNMDRIHTAVTSKGEYDKIVEVIDKIMTHLLYAQEHLPLLQSLFNDPRSNKIEAT